MLQPAITLIDNNQDRFPLKSLQLVGFLENTAGSNDPITQAQEYTQNIPSLIQMLKKMYPHLKKQSIENRIHQISKKLTAALHPPIQTNERDQYITKCSTDYESNKEYNFDTPNKVKPTTPKNRSQYPI